MIIYLFNKTRFGEELKASYKDETYKITGLDFKEALIEIQDLEEYSDAFWVRCESIDMLDKC
jgi:hypothetical protein